MDPLEFIKNIDDEYKQAQDIQKRQAAQMGLEGTRELAQQAAEFRKTYKRETRCSSDELVAVTRSYIDGMFDIISRSIGGGG